MKSSSGFWLVIILVWWLWVLGAVAHFASQAARHLTGIRWQLWSVEAGRVARFGLDEAGSMVRAALSDPDAVTFMAAPAGRGGNWLGVSDAADRILWLVSDRRPPGEDMPDVLRWQPLNSGLDQIEVGWSVLPHPEGDGHRHRYEYAWAVVDVELAGYPPPANRTLEEWNRDLSAHPPEGWRNLADSSEPVEEMPDHLFQPAAVPLAMSLEAAIYASYRLQETTTIFADIRLRYYWQAIVWNPWNVDVKLNPGAGSGGTRPVWQWIARGMPRVRVHNETLGISTDWIALDDAENEGWQRERHVAAWVEVPGMTQLPAGEVEHLFEPDPRRQPQGLSRLVARAFPVRPADRIRLEWETETGEATWALHRFRDGLRPQDYDESTLEWSISGIPIQMGRQTWMRADSGDPPFLLDGASRGFRRDGVQWRWDVTLDPEKLEQWIHYQDPRTRQFHWMSPLWDEPKSVPAKVWESGVAAGTAVLDASGWKSVLRAYGERRSFANGESALFTTPPPAGNVVRRQWGPGQGGGLGLGLPDYGFPVKGSDRWYYRGDLSVYPRRIPWNSRAATYWLPLLTDVWQVPSASAIAWMGEMRRLSREEPLVWRSLHDLAAGGRIQRAWGATSASRETGWRCQSDLLLADNVIWVPRGRWFLIHAGARVVDRISGDVLARSTRERWIQIDP